MKKQNTINLIKEALRIQGKRWCVGALTTIVLALVLGTAAFIAGMPICGSLAVAGVLALVFCFYWFAVKPLGETIEIEEE